MLDVARHVFDKLGEVRFINLAGIEHGPDCTDLRAKHNWSLRVRGITPMGDDYQGTFDRMDRTALKTLWYPPIIAGKQSEILDDHPDAAALLETYRTKYQCVDFVGVLAHPFPGQVSVLCAGYAVEPTITPYLRRAFSQIGLHVEAALRARSRPECLLAVIRSDGKILHLEKGTPSKVREHVRRIEAARTRKRRTSIDALDLWKAIVDGRASILERFDTGQRLYFVIENPPASQPFRALDRDEVDVISYATRGLSSKLVAYGLGISEGEVSARLASAARKIGVVSRLELVRLAAMLARDPRARFEELALTTAEKDVLELLQQGLTNQQIASIRDRSVRTIANQVASLLRKTRHPSRRALAARS